LDSTAKDYATFYDWERCASNDGNEYCIKKATLCNPELLQKMQHCVDMRERGTAINEVVSNKSMLTRHALDGTTQMNLSNKVDEDNDIFASVGEYDGAGADAEAEECTEPYLPNKRYLLKYNFFLVEILNPMASC
jgi:hypothetical protein